MLSQLKRLGADALLYAFMNVGTKIIAFIMFPIYTAFLPDPADYGVLDYIDRITSMLTFLVIFGTDSSLAFYYFDSKDEKKRTNYVRAVMYFRLSIVLIIALIVAIAGPYLSELLLENRSLYYLFYLSVAVLALDTIVALVLTVLRYDFFTKKVVIYTVLKMLLIALFSYWFLASFSATVDSILYGRIVAGAVILLFLLKPTIHYLKLTFNKQILKEILAYAAPLVPASLAFWVIVNANVFFLKEFTSFTEVGIYGSAVKFATLITLLTSGVQMAWRPFSMSLKEKKDSPLLFSKIYYLVLIAGMFGILAIATVMPWVIRLLNENYFEAFQYVAILSSVTFLNFYYLIISVGIFFSKKTKIISYAFGFAAVINVVLNVAFIPFFSIWGSVAAYLLSYMIAITYIYFKSQKLYYVPVSFLKLSYLFITALLGVIAIVYIQTSDISDVTISFVWIIYIILVLLSRVDKDLRQKSVENNIVN